MDQKRHWLSARSVATRTTIIVVCVVTIVLLTVGLWQVQRVRTIISEEVRREASHSMEGAIKVMDNRVSNVETALQTAASYADIFAGDEQRAYGLLHRLLDSNDDIDAVCLMYEADFFPKKGRYYCPVVSRNPVTGVEKEDNLGDEKHRFRYLEENENWECTVETDAGYWCMPYYDSLTNSEVVVSYSVPVHDASGKIYAVLCADVGLGWVKRMVEESKPYPYSTVTVLSRDSQYVCHPDEALVQSMNAVKQAQMIHDDGYLQLTQRMLKGEKGIDTLEHALEYLNTKESADGNTKAIVFYAPVNGVNWSVCFTIPEEKIMERPNHLRVMMITVLLLVIALLAAVLHGILKRQLRPLRELGASVLKVAEGNFHVQLPEIKTEDEVRSLRDSFEQMQMSLSEYMKKLKTTTALKASMESELRIASDIQMSMIPKKFPAYPERDDIDVYGLLTPAKEVGGDLFDFYIRNEKLFFCIGDVTGKGVPASLLMAVTRSQFRTISTHEAMPDRIVTAINEVVADNNESNMFVTLFVGVLDLPTGRLRYCNAGHEAPLLMGRNVGKLPCNPNVPIGVQQNWRYRMQEACIDPNTTIFLYTDGLTEAENAQLQLMGEDRVIAVANATLGQREPETVIRKMETAVNDFVGTACQSDDLTMLAIQYTRKRLANSYQLSLTLDNDVRQVPELNEFVDEVCEAMQFDMSTTMQMNLAIEEAVVNVMNYAYPQGVNGEVNIEAVANNERLKFVIRDHGVPFDPTAKDDADTSLTAEERPIGGLGIFLVKELMDSVNYEYIDGCNVLTLRKTLSPVKTAKTEIV